MHTRYIHAFGHPTQNAVRMLIRWTGDDPERPASRSRLA